MSVATFLEGLRRGHRLRRSRKRRLAFCTIATESFLPWTLVLFDSLQRHYPGAARVLLYVRADGEAHRVPTLDGVDVIAVEDLVEAGAEERLRRRYGLAELCFALKPALLRYCLDRGGERAFYMDSDLDLHGRLDQAMIGLEASSAVLTPHLDAALPPDGRLPSEVTISRAGAFNAGFVAISESPEARGFLAWWGDRAMRWGFVAPEWGYQGDQKWLDLAPGLFPGIGILRDPGCNVGCWNLHARRFERGPGGITVNGSPLAFFHFSGFDPDDPSKLSRYQNRVRLADQPIVAELAADLARRVVAARPRAAALRWTARGNPAAPVARAPAPLEVLPAEAYRVAYAMDPLHGSYSTGEEIAFTLRLTNLSEHAWPTAPRAGEPGIALSHHLYDEHHVVLAWDNPRQVLPRDLGPGETIEMIVGIRAPHHPGRFHLELDLVQEGVTWFSARNAAAYRFPVTVGMVDPPA